VGVKVKYILNNKEREQSHGQHCPRHAERRMRFYSGGEEVFNLLASFIPAPDMY